MKKKIISILSITLMIMAILLGGIVSYAKKADNPLIIHLAKPNYSVGDPTEPGGKYIWNIISNSEEKRNLYCVKAEYGNTWETQPEENVTYNLQYDLQDDIQQLTQKIISDPNGVVASILATGENGIYEELIALFDMLYIPGKTDKDEYLENIGVLKDEQGYYYIGEDKNEYEYEAVLTEEEIIAIQKVAIWKFTNGGDYSISENTTQWLNVKTGVNETTGKDIYQVLSLTGEGNEGIHKNKQANLLYQYLVKSAANKENQYTEKNKITINTEGLKKEGSETEGYNYILQTRIVNGKYITGPIKIAKTNNAPYNIGISVTNKNGNVSFDYTDVNGVKIDGATIKSLVGVQDGFYISTDISAIDELKIAITVTQEDTTKTLWLAGNEDEQTGDITLTGEQPIVEIERTTNEETTNFIVKTFDLALRKYITALHDKNGVEKTISNARNLNNISLDSLLTDTTATYKHRKDPVVVEDKDEVTYQIRIYNEGNKAGYASKIIDQLPTGLIYSNSNSLTMVSKDKDGNVKNTYNVQQYEPTLDNKIILTIVDTTENPARSLNPYTTGNLDYETIEIKCKVVQEPDTKNQIVLTNVAWIDVACNSEDGKEITTTVGDDRDSEPKTTPNVNKDNMQNYTGKDTNKDELSDSGYFYKGEQDDDDFEKLVIMPVEKIFDLALFKHIAAISKDQTIENGEYVTDTGNIDGTYLRAPVVTAIDPDTGIITYEQDDKEALTVEPGDYVLYTIRVYNEGEVNGYASKIKDTLPIGLEFVVENEEYNGIWNLDGLDTDGRQIVSTTWYAKGQGAEADAKEEEANYKANLLKALNKEGAISNENPDYLDAQVLCRVVEQDTSDRILVNYAQISDDSDENGDEINDVDSTPDEWIDGEDDQDIERIKLQCFDLSLRKFISSVNGKAPSISREPNVDESNLINKTDSTSVYNHSKQPLGVQVGDTIIYTIRVYNEGDINGYASEVKDYLPPYLTYVQNSDINSNYGWQISEDGRIATTSYLADTELKAFNGTELDYADLKIECIVSKSAPLKEKLTNIAEISEYTYNGNIVDKDIDSTSDNIVKANDLPNDEELPSYKDEEINKSYVPGNEDDDDFEKIYIKSFDLSLRKFVNKVNGETLESSREPVVDVTLLKNGTDTTAIYNHPKTPVALKIGDIVTYTIRVYNEGEIDGYANKVKDYLPPYLTYVKDSEINIQYGWQMSEDGRIATTTYLSNKKISAFNGTALDYEDLQIECKINENAISEEKITNIAEISEYKYGDTIVQEDIDSESDNIDENLPEDKDLPSYKEEKENDKYVPGNEDDDDFEKLYVKIFDLSLRKFISSVNGNKLEISREPVVDVTPLKNGESTAIYNHPKTPVSLKVGATVIYTIRVYNEGEIDGYANEVKDYLPPYLEFVQNSKTNSEYGWKISEDGRIATTTYLSNKEISAFNGTILDYEDLQIECKISNNAIPDEKITNIAEISEYKYGDTIFPEDIDSKSDNIDENLPEDKDLPKYKEEKENDKYVPGNEDDDDFEKIYVKEFDLALRKFITQVQNKEITSRIPQPKDENGVISYEHPKDPITVHVDDVVIYTLRIYNEGEIDGYASEITDDIPEYLEYLPEDSTNKAYMWKMYDKDGNETENVEDAIKVKTEYLSKENGEDNLIKAYNGQNLHYKDIKIAFKVKDPNSNQYIITNYAQISDDTDEDGNEIKDKDSEPDVWKEGEDDQDIENVKVEYFDLSIVKFVSKVIVIENGKETITETGYNGHENPEPVVKVELHKKKLNEVVVKFGYGITVTNEGDIPGYATELTDYVPEGLRFEASDNPNWKDEGNNVISTKQLENKLLQPGESATVEVIFTWINGSENLALKTNIVEISDDKNEYDVPDRDSTPDNKKDGEDDIDIAKVILTITTGAAKTYFTLTLGLLAVVAVGVGLIKKFVI